jgi:hypothetical protein
LGKSVRTLGYILLAAGSSFILGGQFMVLKQHGLSELQQMMSPLNLRYYGAVLVIVAPGAALIALGQWLDARRRHRRRRSPYLSD